MTITAAELNKLSIEQLEILYRKIQPPTKEQKKSAWKAMDTGIYDENGNLIGDACTDEDSY